MIKSVLAIAVALATVISLAATPTFVGIRNNASAQVPAQLPAMPTIPPTTTNPEDHLPVHTVQDDNHIITTVTKHGEAPTGPVIIIPPGPEGGQNGTIITPGENVTAENPGNITIITPGGNVTELPGNVTNVGNDTVIITPPDRNVTETPGNVTVISPPLGTGNETTNPAPCTCNQTNQQPPATIPPVIIQPAPGQNITQLPSQPPSGSNQTQPSNPNPPSGNESGQQPNPPANNETAAGSGGNQTGNTGGNETQTNPSGNSTSPPPHATQLPASTIISPFLPGVHINSISYNGVNSQYLHK